MKLVWIHGPPAAGKLTVAKQLKANYGFKLLHNHLAVDLCLSIYDFVGDRDFHDYADFIRRTVLTRAKELGVKRMAMTYMVCAEKDRHEVQEYLNFFNEQEIEVFPVQLCPKADVLLERVSTEERKTSSKISKPEFLAKLIAATKFSPIEHERLLVIDNSDISPSDAAARIMEHIKSYDA